MAKENQSPRRGSGPGSGGPGMRAMMHRKAKNFKKTIRRLFTNLAPYSLFIIIVIIFSIGSSILAIFGPTLLGQITDTISTSLSKNIPIDFDAILTVIYYLLGLYIASAVSSYLQSFIMSSVTIKFSFGLRKKLAEKINRVPLGYYDNTNHGDVLSRITNDIDTVESNLNQTMTTLISSITSLVGVLVMMFSISWILSLVSLLIIPLSLISVMKIIKSSQKYFRVQQKYLGDLNAQIEEVYGSHTIIKAFNGEEKAEEQFNQHNNRLRETGWKSQFLSSLMFPTIHFVGNIGYVAICILGGYLSITTGNLSIGNIQSFIQYLKSFNQPLIQTANASNIIQSLVAAAERVYEFIDEEEEIIDGLSLDENSINGNVRFENIVFGYNKDKIIINNFCADIKAGQKIAIVGPTGAGKTTIVKLLMRFYDLNEGEIYIDDIAISTLAKDQLRKVLGMVLQDTWLFNGSVMDNIRYGNLSASDEEVITAAKTAHVHEFILSLPGGYNFTLNEEASNISQGQKQLLTIARAILANPKILILDEATSSVDTRTEIIIQKAMENLMKNRTTFIIAHRLSTIRNADLILAMNNGDIVEQGSHQNLIEQNNFYASLYRCQFDNASD